MKKTLICAVAGLAMIFSACSSDDDGPAPGKIYPEKTYTESNGLQLTVGGAPALGKSVTYKPDTKNSRNAELLLEGYFDMATIPDFPTSLAQTVKTAGIIPGDLSTTLPITLVPDGQNASFSGSADAQYCTYSYSGSISDDGLVLAIKDVKLKNTSLCGKWVPDEYKFNPTTEEIESNPVYAVWESSAMVELNGLDVPVGDLLKILMVTPLIKEDVAGQEVKLNIPQALEAVLRDVEFRDDANIIATIADEEDGAIVPFQNPANVATYVVTGAGDFNFYLNPTAVVALEEAEETQRSRVGAGTLPNMDALLTNVMTQLAAMMEGLPMHYDLQGSNLKVYVGTEVLRHLLKTDVLPLLEDEVVVAKLIELIRRQQGMESVADQLPTILNSLALVIEGTTRLEIGLNLHK